MLTVEQALERLGLEKGRFLGSGAFAQVWEVKGDPTRVIKVTHDEADAYVAELARRAQNEGKCPNLVRVYRVIEVESPLSYYRNYGRPAFLEINERLQPISDEMEVMLPWSGVGINGQYDLFYAVRDAKKGYVDPGSSWHKNDPRYSVWGYIGLNAKGMVEDLMSLGVTDWDDFKVANVMYRPGDRIVVTDFGCTNSPTPKIERLD